MTSSTFTFRRRALPVAAVTAALGVTVLAMGVSLSRRFPFEFQLKLSHLALIAIALTLLGLALYFRDGTRGVLARFFYAAQRPLNLAIYRVVLFGTILFDLDNDADRGRVTFFAELPKGLQVPPPGLGPVLDVLPINAMLAHVALTGLTVFSFLAMIGWRTRLSGWLTVGCALYALGIPQFYGQVNHYHHMIWFAAILAASRCGDVLSVDAFLTARSRARAGGTVAPPAESRAYALPLRFVWLMIGVVYFFPGFWKYWRSGMDWAFSDNFVHQLHLKWMQREWVAPFRVDEHPWLFMPAAFATLVWEIGFLPAMVFPRVRAAFAVVGAMFHICTRLLMHISFWTLQTSYLSFFNWDAIFRRLGKRLYREEMLFLYDGHDAAVRGRVAAWRTLDVFFGRVTYVNVHDVAAMTAAGVQIHDAAATLSGFAGVRAIVARETFEGASAWRKLAGRIPPLWVVRPFVGRSVGGGAAQHPADTAALSTPWFPRAGIAGVTAVFAVLLTGNTLFGVKEQRTGFPFTCYPPFSRDPGPVVAVIHIEPVDADGDVIDWDERALKKQFGSARYVSLIRHLRMAKDPKKFHAFWEVVAEHNPQVRKAEAVRFWETTLHTNPRYWLDVDHDGDIDPQRIKRELVYTHVEAGATPATLDHNETVTADVEGDVNAPAE